jgi:hypothetical protein
MSMTRILPMAGLAAALGACGQAAPAPNALPAQPVSNTPSYGPVSPTALSNMLTPGMTQDRVQQLAWPPGNTTDVTCRERGQQPYPCQQWRYGGLTVSFRQQPTGQWVVSHWEF